MELSAVQTLAGWIVFVQRAGANGAMFPPRNVLEEIVQRKAGRYEEAEALAKHFLDKVHAAPPSSPLETGAAGMKFVRGINDMVGGIFSSPPTRPAK